MRKQFVCLMLLSVLTASAIGESKESTVVEATENNAELSVKGNEEETASEEYNFVQCIGTRVLLRKGPGKNFGYYKWANGKPVYANDPDEYVYLGVTKNGYHKIEIWLSNKRSSVAWISAQYSYRY